MRNKELFYTWNVEEYIPENIHRSQQIDVCSYFDETLRDGIQAPTVRNPTLDEKLQLVDCMASSGISCADLGFPGAGDAMIDECISMVDHIIQNDYEIAVGFAGRTSTHDIDSIARIAEATQSPVDAYAFVAISPIRQYVQLWDFEKIEDSIKTAAGLCKKGGVNFILVLEDAFRCPPTMLERFYNLALEHSASRVCICDTVGAAHPRGVEAIVSWSIRFFQGNGKTIPLEWHGHNDQGLAVANSLTAVAAGCSRVHGTILGIGERAGNASIDQLILSSFQKTNPAQNSLSGLRKYVENAAALLNIDIPRNYPGFGEDVFTTSAGVHAAAILKADKLDDILMKDLIYSSVPAQALGREQKVLIDEMSGLSNIEYWFRTRGREDYTASIGRRILEQAKKQKGTLSDKAIYDIIKTSN